MTTATKKISSVLIASVRRDGGTQFRAAVDEDHAGELAEFLLSGGEFDDLPVVFDDDKDFWLAHGFHRFRAYELVGRRRVEVEVIQGSQRAAQLYAAGCNRGAKVLPRKRVDIRNAVLFLLNDAEWSAWADAEIARHCGVDPKTVGKYRREHLGNSRDAPRKATRNGKTYEMDTADIGPDSEDVPLPHGVTMEDFPARVRVRWTVMPKKEKLAVIELVQAQLEEKRQEEEEGADAVPSCGSSVAAHAEQPRPQAEIITQGLKKLQQARNLFDKVEGAKARAVVRLISDALEMGATL